MGAALEDKLLATTDAKVWAQEFMRAFADRRQDIDEALMIGWFANAFAAAISAEFRADAVGRGEAP